MLAASTPSQKKGTASSAPANGPVSKEGTPKRSFPKYRSKSSSSLTPGGRSGYHKSIKPCRFIYISHLAKTVRAAEIGLHFSAAGDLERVNLCKEVDTRRTWNHAYVSFSTVEGAKKAIEMFNNTPFSGRTIYVTFDRTGGNPPEAANLNSNSESNPQEESKESKPAPAKTKKEVDQAPQESAPTNPKEASKSLQAETSTESKKLPINSADFYPRTSTTQDASEFSAPMNAPNEGDVQYPASEYQSSIRTNVLWIGNLPTTIGWQDVKALVQAYSGVAPKRVELATDLQTGESRGHASVTFMTIHEAQIAAAKLTGVPCGYPARSLLVSPDKRHPPVDTCVFICNIPFTVSWLEIKNLFEENGFHVKRVMLAPPHPIGGSELNHSSHAHRGFGTVVLISPEEATAAIEILNGYAIHGRQIDVRALDPEYRVKHHRVHSMGRNGTSGAMTNGNASPITFDANVHPETTASSGKPHRERSVTASGLLETGYEAPTTDPVMPEEVNSDVAVQGDSTSADQEPSLESSETNRPIIPIYKPKERSRDYFPFARLYIGNVHWNANFVALKNFMREHGVNAGKVDIVVDPNTQRPRGYALVSVFPPNTHPGMSVHDIDLTGITPHTLCQAAIQRLNGLYFMGRPLIVEVDKSRSLLRQFSHHSNHAARYSRDIPAMNQSEPQPESTSQPADASTAEASSESVPQVEVAAEMADNEKVTAELPKSGSMPAAESA